MPRIRENYTVMSITIDPVLKTWLQRGEDTLSATTERIIRDAHNAWKRHQDHLARNQRKLTEPSYAWTLEQRQADKAKSLAVELGRAMRDHNIKSDRCRMLKYELTKFISEVARREY